MPNDIGSVTPDPGPKTTEFWVTVLTTLLSLAVAGATVTQHSFDPQGLQVLIPSVAVVAAAITSAIYAHTRAAVKMSAQAASATILSAAAQGLTPAPVSPATPPAVLEPLTDSQKRELLDLFSRLVAPATPAAPRVTTLAMPHPNGAVR